MWEKLTDDGSIHAWHHFYIWDNAFAVKIATLNSGSFAGYNDWRVPNYKELNSILNLENSFPAVAPAFHTGCIPGCNGIACACTQPSGYWSSTSFAFNPTLAWIVYFNVGSVDLSGKSSVFYVRAVRSGS